MKSIEVFWRFLSGIMALVLLWVFAHDYVALEINSRIDEQIKQVQMGGLDFSWDVSETEDVVTFFDSRFDGGTFTGSKAAVSLQMPAWPLIPRLYQKMLLDFETDADRVVSVVLETSDLNAGVFYSAKVQLEPGKHELDLNALSWEVTSAGQVVSGVFVDWQTVTKASTWVVRFFSQNEFRLRVNQMVLPQTEIPVSQGWQEVGCGGVNQAGQWLASCSSSNQMVQLDHQVNRHSVDQVIKFKPWLSFQSWIVALVVVALFLFTFLGKQDWQRAVLLVAFVCFCLLYFDPKYVLFLDNANVFAVMSGLALLYVLFLNRSRWQVSQKGSIGLWLVVSLLALALWWLGDFGLDFLPLVPAYLLWACFQQTSMVTVYEWLNVGKKGRGENKLLLFFIASCFAAVHLPNHYLMLLTFFGGLFWMWVWFQSKNLLLMVVSHSIWALLLYQWAGETWLYSARVGANFL